jgi:hypothetical protein
VPIILLKIADKKVEVLVNRRWSTRILVFDFEFFAGGRWQKEVKELMATLLSCHPFA